MPKKPNVLPSGKVRKDAATSTNRDSITPGMRQGYRTTLREKQALIDEIKHVQELLKQGDKDFEVYKAAQLKEEAVQMNNEASTQGHVVIKPLMVEKKVAAKPPKEKRAPKEKRPPKEKREPTERKAPEPANERRLRSLTPWPKPPPVRTEQEKQTTAAKPPRQVHIVHEKRIREVEEVDEDMSDTSLVYARDLHKEIAAMHDAIQRRVCMAGAFITFLIILIIFY